MQIAMGKNKFAGVSWDFAVKNSGKSFMQWGPGQTGLSSSVFQAVSEMSLV